MSLIGPRRADVDDVSGSEPLLPRGGADDEPPAGVDVDRLAGHLTAGHGDPHLLTRRDAQLR